MADEVPHKSDIMTVFKRLRAIPANKMCFDCNAKNPTWATVTYGVFLCIDCSAVHRGLGVHVTFVRSTQLDTNWTWLQLRNMQMGGNANARKFFHQHNCATTDAQQKYHSRAAQLYRDKLHGLAVQAMKLHGTQLHIDTGHHDSAAGDKAAPEVDFFDAHTAGEFEAPPTDPDHQYSAAAHFATEPEPEAAPTNGSAAVPGVPTAGPSVPDTLGTSPPGQPAAAAAPRKSTIGQRRPAAKLGARKLGGGLGAQKVKKDFSEIERQAEQADMMRTEAEQAKQEEVKQSAEERDRQLANVRLAYQDLSVQQKKQSDKLKNMDPKKAEQMERLGMGFGAAGGGGYGHSSFSDMQTIDQGTPASDSSAFTRSEKFGRKRDDLLDDFEHVGFTSSSKNKAGGDEDDDFFGGFSSGSGSGSGGFGSGSGLSGLSGSGGWGKSSGSSKTSGIGSSSGSSSWDRAPAEKPARRQPPADVGKASCGDDAQKKFGNAKAISSASYFGDERPSFESQQNINRFQGASGISSADYFGEPQRNRAGAGGSSMQAPDLEDVKESVRQGVTKVAGKLGTLANGVMSSLQ